MKNNKRRKYRTPKRKQQLEMRKALFMVTIIAFGIIAVEAHNTFKALAYEQRPIQNISINTDYDAGYVGNSNLSDSTDTRTVQELIIDYARDYNVDPYTALEIADCESGFNPKAKNNQGSSATGVYQFINKTWNNYCTGNRTDAEDNIKCFMELYPKYPDWWACNNLI